MELTLEQALQKGIEAHKAGKTQEADRYYTAILKAQPKHPDANHNIGVLAVGVGKVQEAIPYFKTALEANPAVSQFWLSYIDALIKLNRIADAKAVFDQAKSKGAKGESFDQLEKKLIQATKQTSTKTPKTQDPPKDQMQTLVDFYSNGKLKKVLVEAQRLIKDFPLSADIYNIVGAANQSLGQYENAINAYKKALEIKPDHAEIYYNLGISLKDHGMLSEAKKSYEKAVSIKPDYAEA